MIRTLVAFVGVALGCGASPAGAQQVSTPNADRPGNRVLVMPFDNVSREGRIFWLWLAWYAVGRLLFGYLRIGEPTPLLGLRQDQLVAVGALALALPVLALLQAGVLGRLRVVRRVT